MIHTSYFRPRIYPYNGDIDPGQIDRVQSMSARSTLNRIKIEEIAREGIVGWRKGGRDTTLTVNQLEFGTNAIYNFLANVSSSTSKVEFTDFKSSAVDIVGYKTDDDGTFLGSVWYPEMRISRISLNIGDPESLIERSFELVGENEILLQGDNKYFIYKKFTASGGTPETFTISNPSATADPDNSGQYLFRVLRVRSGVTTELTYSTDYTFDGTTLSINTEANDVIKVYYSASSYISGESIFTNNDSDDLALDAKGVSIYLATSNYLYRLQSVSVDVAFDRFDIKEIGNANIVDKGVRDITTTVTLGEILEDYTIEEVLRNENSGYGKIDLSKLSDDFSLIVKIYSDSNKSTFRMGYKLTDLAPTGIDNTVDLNDYVKRGITLEGESGFITNSESDL